MKVFDAVCRLKLRPVETREDVFDVEVSFRGDDLWAEAATAAISLAGFLDDAKTDQDLDEGLAHFQTCQSAEILGTEAWFQEIAAVVMEVGRELQARGTVGIVEVRE